LPKFQIQIEIYFCEIDSLTKEQNIKRIKLDISKIYWHFKYNKIKKKNIFEEKEK
jgi:hypothetical protein